MLRPIILAATIALGYFVPSHASAQVTLSFDAYALPAKVVMCSIQPLPKGPPPNARYYEFRDGLTMDDMSRTIDVMFDSTGKPMLVNVIARDPAKPKDTTFVAAIVTFGAGDSVEAFSQAFTPGTRPKPQDDPPPMPVADVAKVRALADYLWAHKCHPLPVRPPGGL